MSVKEAKNQCHGYYHKNFNKQSVNESVENFTISEYINTCEWRP